MVFLLFPDTGSFYVALTGLEFTLSTRLASNLQQSSCLGLPSTGLLASNTLYLASGLEVSAVTGTRLVTRASIHSLNPSGGHVLSSGCVIRTCLS